MPRNSLPNRWCFPTKVLLDTFDRGVFAGNIGAALGVTRSCVQRWRDDETMLDPYKADKLAVKLGKHPSEIWLNWFDLPEYENPLL